MTASNPTDITINPASGVPDWWSNDGFHPVGQWRAYAGGTNYSAVELNGVKVHNGSRISDIISDAAVTTYSGAAIDNDKRAVYLHGGGHAAAGGESNAVLKLDLSANQPGYSIIGSPTPGARNYSQFSNGHGYYDGDPTRPVASHTSAQMCVANGYLWKPLMWGMHNTSQPTCWQPGQTATTASTVRWRMNTNTGVWESLGKVIQTYPWEGNCGSSRGVGEGTTSTLLESRNEIFMNYRPSNTTTDPWTVVLDAVTGAVKNTYLRATWKLMDWAGVGCEIYPAGARPSVLLLYGMVEFTGGGFFLVDPAVPGSHYGPLTLDNQSGYSLNFSGTDYGMQTLAGRSSLCHLHGTNKIFMSACSFSGTTPRTYLQITIPSETTVAALASATWTVNAVTPGGATQPPASTQGTHIYNRYGLIRNMGDGRPCIFFIDGDNTDGAPALSSPVWVLKLNAQGGLT